MEQSLIDSFKNIPQKVVFEENPIISILTYVQYKSNKSAKLRMCNCTALALTNERVNIKGEAFLFLSKIAKVHLLCAAKQ